MQLTVRPTSAVLRYSERSEDPVAVGRALDVEAVLDGRIQRSGERVRVTLQLISVSDGAQLWAGQFDEQFTHLFELQDSISTQVARSLSLQLSSEEQQRMRKDTENIEASEAYLKGRYFWSKRTAEDLRRSIEYFKQAIDLDPGYALAYVGLAEAYLLLVPYSGAAPKEFYPRAKAAAMKALEVDGALAEAHASLAEVKWYHEWDAAGAEAEFRKALDLHLNDATAYHWYGEFLGQRGRFDEGVAHLQ